jgi:glycosidase
VNVEHPYQRQGLKNWGDWLTTKTGFDGFRWDATHHVGSWFVSEFMAHGLKQGQFGVMEYWLADSDATVKEHDTWLALTDYRCATFDMRLHDKLETMCNQDGTIITFNMEDLSRGAMIHLNALWAVTFPESHDTIRPYREDDKEGITKDKMLAYAFVLLSEGLPMIAYNDYFTGPNVDPGTPEDPVDDGWTGSPLKPQMDPLIDARRKYAGGTTSYLSQTNKPDLYIAKRNGTSTKAGCVLVINDNFNTALFETVNTGWTNTTTLVDILNTNYTASMASGVATLGATNRSYRVLVRQEDLLP